MNEALEDPETKKTVITCEPTIDINFASALYEYLKIVLGELHEVEIHAGNVIKVDTAILQVFLVFVVEAKSLNLRVSWVSVSETFRASADLLGLSTALNLPKES